jgi:hypothetical protein
VLVGDGVGVSVDVDVGVNVVVEETVDGVPVVDAS